MLTKYTTSRYSLLFCIYHIFTTRNDKHKTMEDSSDIERPFDLLPKEMVIYLLSFVHSDVLLNCRLVCKIWKKFIEKKVFQEKAFRENKIHRFNSFSHIDLDSVKKLDLPWFVFYAICKHDPFNRNLVKNNCGQTEFSHWELQHNSNVNKWAIEQIPQDVPALPDDPDFGGHKRCFASYGGSCNKVQLIRLYNYGLNSNLMKSLQPDILVSDWCAAYFNCHFKSTYKAHFNVYECDGQLLNQQVFRQMCKSEWIKVSRVFKNQGNASFVIVIHDVGGMAGYSRHKVAGTVVKVLLPTKFKYENILE